MSWKMIKIEGGSGGKLGRSNMSHFEGAVIVKQRSKKARRKQSKMEIRQITGIGR